MDPPEPKNGNAEATTCFLEGYCYGSWRRHAGTQETCYLWSL